MDQSEDSAELAEFRERWKAEVRGRQQGSSQIMHPSRVSEETQTSSDPPNLGYIHQNMMKRLSLDRDSFITAATESLQLAGQKEQEYSSGAAHNFHNRTSEGGHHEDVVHNGVENGSSVIPKQRVSGVEVSPDRSLRHSIKVKPTSSDEPGVYRDLRKLVSSFGSYLHFVAENELPGCYLNILPDELLISILQYLEPVYVERFALVCKKARLLTLEPSIWECVCYVQG